MAAATSSGVPARRMGVARAAIFSDSVEEAVCIQPGATALKVTPCSAISRAVARIIPSMADFAAPYAAEPGELTSGPVTEETFTMRPEFCFFMVGRKAPVIREE